MNNLKQWLGGTLLALGIATQPVLASACGCTCALR